MSVNNLNIVQFFKEENIDVEKLRNLSIIAHVDHGKSTLTDNLLGEVGLINQNLAGVQLATDCFEEQSKRGITINSTSVSFPYKDHLFTVIDSPGHVEFNSEVVRSLRSSDGAILVVDIIDGVMTQTETVLGQALNEGIDIILFINKVDRIITEKLFNSEEILQRMKSTVSNINNLICRLTERKDQYFRFDKNIVFGSALCKWGTTIPYLNENKKSFKEILENVKSKSDLSKTFNLAEILLDTCIKEISNPQQKQPQKIQRTYKLSNREDDFSKLPEEILKSSPKEKFLGIVTDVNFDEFSGLLTTVRVLSGTYRKKDPLYCSNNQYKSSYKSPTRIMINAIKKFYDIDCAFAGTIVVFQGTESFRTGDTISSDPCEIYYPDLKYARNPIVAYAITPKETNQLKKMIDCIKNLIVEDPTLAYEYNEEEKEFLLYGVGVLHLEVALKKLELCYKIKVNHSKPLVAYSETLGANEKSITVDVRTSNKLNDFSMFIFKLPFELTEKLLKNEVTNKNLANECMNCGIPKELAKDAVKILKNGCVYFNHTKGCSFMDQTKDNLTSAMELALSVGHKLKKPLKGIGFVLTFAKIHEDGLHRGITQLRSAFRKGLDLIFEKKPPTIVEPVMELTIESPYKYTSAITSELTQRKGYVIETTDSEISGYFKMKAGLTLRESLDINALLMSVTEGRVLCDINLSGYVPITDMSLIDAGKQ